MRVHVLEREQVVPREPGEVWEFFSDAHNLGEITPPYLRFEVLTPRPIAMGEGALIEYRLRLHGFPLSWLTRIDEWEPPDRFVDRQLRGPFQLWHHTHTFAPHPDGTLVRDRVRYRIGLGLLGALARPLVRHDLEGILSFRHDAVARRLRSQPTR